MKKRWWGLITVGVIVLAGGGFFWKMSSAGPVGPIVATAPVTKGAIENKIFASGIVKPKQEVTIFSPNNGTLQNMVLKEGDSVQQGQVIGQLDITDTTSEMATIDAQIVGRQAELSKLTGGKEPELIAQQQEKINQAKAQVASAQREHDRMKALLDAGAVPGQDYDKAKEALQQANSSLSLAVNDMALTTKGPKQADLASVQAQIKELEIRKAELMKKDNNSSVTAPFAGTVLSLVAKNGQMVSKGSEVLTLGDLNKLSIEAQISESDIPNIKLGQKAVVSGTSMGKETASATVTKISPMASKEQKGETTGKTKVNVTLELDKAVSILKPGFNVDVDIMVENKENILVVPFTALVVEGETSYVWVSENGIAKKRTITTAMESDILVEIKSGLQEGDQVITNPTPFITEGSPVISSAEMPVAP
ncbi:efflux RND transporter periplasmic adaptor subunit [Brevibacillus daliensis]|uniref:efflux RND transporter periplasmic adaptor subunit n=1 Tax=Brevibacillus daliensis TaxID=2892995 RepID=UPI001E4345DE|nr:efflux RND transporter periplasmic adaptor subunit [Brevibacillus daliensis]